MARSNHHGCGGTCGLCRPHKKWRSNSPGNLSVRDRKALESAEFSLVDNDVEREEPKLFVDEKKARQNDHKRTAMMIGLVEAIRSGDASVGDVAKLIQSVLEQKDA
jgi:hypothetical protein